MGKYPFQTTGQSQPSWGMPRQGGGQSAPQQGSPFFSPPAQQRPSDAAYGAQSAKDQSLFNNIGNLGIGHFNALGQLGTSRNNALTNQSIAAANAYNGMAAGWMNTMGQLGQYGAGMAAAAGQNVADTNKYQMLGGALQGIGNAGMYGSQAGAYGMGNMPNMSFGGFGGGGFNASGPGGLNAGGSYGGGGYGGGGGGRQFNAPPTPPYMSGGGGQMADTTEPFRAGMGFLNGLRGDLNNSGNFANRAMGGMQDEFRRNRAGIMNNDFLNSVNSGAGMGYDALFRANAGSDYGFNTQYNQPVDNTRDSYMWRSPQVRNNNRGWYSGGYNW